MSTPDDRRCHNPECGCILNRYNPGPLCHPCQNRRRLVLSAHELKPRQVANSPSRKITHTWPQELASLRDKLFGIVCATFGVTKTQILEYNKDPNVSIARQSFVYLLSSSLRATVGQISTALGRHDCAIRYGIGRINHAMKTDALLRHKIEQMQGKIKLLQRASS